MNLHWKLLEHQKEFVNDATTPELLLLGGYGAGKTRAAAYKLLALALRNQGHTGIALSPTYGMASRVLIPEIESVLLENLGEKRFHFNKSMLFFDIRLGKVTTRIYVMAAESWRRVLGLNAAFFLVDEIDTIDPDLAESAWQACMSRLRKGNVFQACATTTPEGFGFTYKRWHLDLLEKEELRKKRRVIHARTADNPFLPESYLELLKDTYSPKQLEAYLEGKWVNLAGANVYCEFDEEKNFTPLSIRDVGDRPLHVGPDFNNNGMSVVTSVILDNVCHVVDEHFGAKNTAATIAIMKQRYDGKRIYVYPDASSRADKTSAAESDLVQLRKAGFITMESNSNPRVRDRVNAVNARFARTKLMVNVKAAPYLTQCLKTQPYSKTGEPLKDGKIDGPVDALGYLVYKNWPFKRPTLQGSIIT